MFNSWNSAKTLDESQVSKVMCSSSIQLSPKHCCHLSAPAEDFIRTAGAEWPSSVHLILLCLKINICTQLCLMNIPTFLQAAGQEWKMSYPFFWIFFLFESPLDVLYDKISVYTGRKTKRNKEILSPFIRFPSIKPHLLCSASASEITSLQDVREWWIKELFNLTGG